MRYKDFELVEFISKGKHYKDERIIELLISPDASEQDEVVLYRKRDKLFLFIEYARKNRLEWSYEVEETDEVGKYLSEYTHTKLNKTSTLVNLCRCIPSEKIAIGVLQHNEIALLLREKGLLG